MGFNADLVENNVLAYPNRIGKSFSVRNFKL